MSGPTLPVGGPAAPAGSRAAANRRLLWLLAAVPVAMLFIGLFAMTRLYTLWCNAQGGATSPNSQAVANQAPVATGRFINVYWSSQVFDRLPVTFRVGKERDRLEVGREGTNTYHIKNLSDQEVRVRPVHQVSPLQATAKFGMRVCFCFREQTLAPREEKDFEIAYSLDPSLDERVNDVSLKYSLFEVKADGPSPEQAAIEAETKRAIVAADDDRAAAAASPSPAPAGTLTGGRP